MSILNIIVVANLIIIDTILILAFFSGSAEKSEELDEKEIR